MKTSADIIIIGGGVIGLTCAMLAAEAGKKVILLERGKVGKESSWAGAGIIPPGNSKNTEHPGDRLRAWSSEQFPLFSEELQKRTGIDNGYFRCGGLEWLDENQVDNLVESWQREQIPFEAIEAKKGSQLWPQLDCWRLVGKERAFYFPSMAQVRNPRHLKALFSSCIELGVEVKENQERVRFQTGESSQKIIGVMNDENNLFNAEHYLIASGAWSDELTVPLGVSLGVKPVRGQIITYQLGGVPFREVILMGKCYLVPRQDGLLLVGATEEWQAGYAKEITESGREDLRQFAEKICPELRKEKIVHQWAGLRPGSSSPSCVPIIDRLQDYPEIWVSTGHFRAGIQLSIGSARYWLDQILQRPSFLPLGAFPLQGKRDDHWSPAFRS